MQGILKACSNNSQGSILIYNVTCILLSSFNVTSVHSNSTIRTQTIPFDFRHLVYQNAGNSNFGPELVRTYKSCIFWAWQFKWNTISYTFFHMASARRNSALLVWT
jgi:hypothetical protein